MPKIVYDIEFKVKGGKTISDSIKNVNGDGFEDLEKKATKANQVVGLVAEQAENLGTGLQKSSVQGVKALNSVTTASKQLQVQQQKTNQSIRSASKITSGANQVFFSFSDGVQDAAQFQFGFAQGMRAIGNNVSFTAELLAQLNTNAQDTGITLGKALTQSLGGVGGALLALNLAISFSTILLSKFGNKAKEAGKEVDGLFDQLNKLSTSDESLGVRTEDLLVRLDQRIELLQSEQAALDQIASFRGTTGITTDQDRRGQTATLKALREIRKEIELQPEFIKNLTDEQQENIRKRIDSQIEELELTKLQRQALASLITEEEKRAAIEEARRSTGNARPTDPIAEDVVSFRERTLQDLIDEGVEIADAEIANGEKYLESLEKIAQAEMRLDTMVANHKLRVNRLAYNAIIGLVEQTFGDSKGAALLILGLEKALAISQVIVDTTRKSAAATSQGFLLAANPLTAFAAPQAFAASAAIKASGARAVALIAATGLIEGAGILAGGGGGGGASSSGFGGGSARSGQAGSPSQGRGFGIERSDSESLPTFTPQGSSLNNQPTFIIEQKVTNKGLALSVRRGNNEIRSNRVEVSG